MRRGCIVLLLCFACGATSSSGGGTDAGLTEVRPPGTSVPPPNGGPGWTPPPRLAELGLPPAQPPMFDDFACRASTSLECGGVARTGLLPAVINGCFNGLYLEARDGAPFLCSFQASSEVPDAGPIAASSFSWSCYGPVPLGKRLDFFMEYTSGSVSASGRFFVRFDGDVDAGDAGALSYQAGGCYDTSSGTGRCASPDTMIATPHGEREIDALAVGDLVYSNDGAGWIVVPVAEVVRVPVPVFGHRVVRLTLDDRRTVAMSAPHPDARGSTFGELVPGDRLGERIVVKTERIDYAFPYTVDIRPSSRSSTYVASGALVGSTLRRR